MNNKIFESRPRKFKTLSQRWKFNQNRIIPCRTRTECLVQCLASPQWVFLQVWRQTGKDVGHSGKVRNQEALVEVEVARLVEEEVGLKPKTDLDRCLCH